MSLTFCLYVSCEHGIINATLWKDKPVAGGSPPVDLFLYVEQGQQCAIVKLSSTQADSFLMSISNALSVAVKELEREEVEPNSILHQVQQSKISIPNTSLWIEGGRTAIHFAKCIVPCTIFMTPIALLRLFLSPFFSYGSSPNLFCNEQVEMQWLHDTLREFSCCAKVASSARQAVLINLGPGNMQYAIYKQGTVHAQSGPPGHLPTTLPIHERALRVYVYDRQPLALLCFYGVHWDPVTP